MMLPAVAADVAPAINGAQTVSYLVTVVLALVSGTGGWSALQFFLNRTGRKAEAARLIAQTEQSRLDIEEAESKRRQILSDFQAKAQQIAIESATTAYERVVGECDACRVELREMRRSTEALIRVVEDIVFTLIVNENDTKRLRLAISMARDNL